jgi:hypothetical protein
VEVEGGEGQVRVRDLSAGAGLPVRWEVGQLGLLVASTLRRAEPHPRNHATPAKGHRSHGDWLAYSAPTEAPPKIEPSDVWRQERQRPAPFPPYAV